jgi:hypothetical protein
MKSYAIAITLLLGAAAPALAANADTPQGNVDKRSDAGNSTGNDKVDALNRGQLDANQKPPATAASTPAAPAPAAPPTAK